MCITKLTLCVHCGMLFCEEDLSFIRGSKTAKHLSNLTTYWLPMNVFPERARTRVCVCVYTYTYSTCCMYLYKSSPACVTVTLCEYFPPRYIVRLMPHVRTNKLSKHVSL